MDPTSALSEKIVDLSVSDPPHEPDSWDSTVILPRVSSDRDLLTDDNHKAFDAEIMETFSAFRTMNMEPNSSSLLSNITLQYRQIVTLPVKEAKELLTRQPLINQVLRKAWNEASFKQVRQLEILWPVVKQAPESPNEREGDIQLANQANPILEALESAWRDDYFGNNHRLLFANINALTPTQKAYSNQIAIVQSSGTGKSRMVHEQANLVFTVPFNLRDAHDRRGLAFPIPDAAVRDYLVMTAVSLDLHTVKTNYIKFLCSIFTQIYLELENCSEELSKKQSRTAENLARWWSSHLRGVRTKLYAEAIVGASEEIQILPAIKKEHEALLAKRRSNPEDSKDSKDSYPIHYDVDTVVEFAAAESARAALGRLIGKLDGLVGVWSRPIKLIIYFDEAHPLTKVVPNDGDEKTLYDILCSCLNHFLAFPVFSIFLSTNSSLAQFAAPQALARSARIRRGDAVTHAPITETPFDCGEKIMVKAGTLRMTDTSQIPFMAQFGRPLFWTLLRGAGLQAPQLFQSVLTLARAKLIGSNGIDSSYHNLLPESKMAVLDVQLSLDYEPHREKVHIQEAALVESHMRIAYSIPDHREYLRSGYPSEPLLAEAAAQQLWKWRTQNPSVVVETLTGILDTGLLDRGELGELTGRQLLLDAYHRAVEQEQSDQHGAAPPNFSAGCRLINFIKALYNDEYADMALGSMPDNQVGIPFKDAFKNARICFTHFGKMADDTGVTSTAAWAAFVRHMAIMCQNGQHSVDCILPVLLWDTKLCEHVMTGVLVQFKRRIRAGTIAKYSIDQAKLGFFPQVLEKCTHGSATDSYRPYVCFIMELGVQVAVEAKTATKYKQDQHSPSSSESDPDGRLRTPPSNQKRLSPLTPSMMYIPQYGKRHDLGQEHARYSIFTYGCSSTLYRGIDNAHEVSYALLLNSRDFLAEHPRKDTETLKAVRRMKPFWAMGEDSYHWMENEGILQGSAPPGERNSS